jgi:hypothetical protein
VAKREFPKPVPGGLDREHEEFEQGTIVVEFGVHLSEDCFPETVQVAVAAHEEIRECVVATEVECVEMEDLEGWKYGGGAGNRG